VHHIHYWWWCALANKYTTAYCIGKGWPSLAFEFKGCPAPVKPLAIEDILELDAREAQRPPEWEPWPAHEAFADEITRWWPSDNWPPKEPPIEIKEQVADWPPEIVAWPMRGGLLDFWV